jgi:hypothetical protein
LRSCSSPSPPFRCPASAACSHGRGA